MNSTSFSANSTASAPGSQCSKRRCASFCWHIATYVLAPSAILLAAHFLITIVLDVSQLYLRLASFIIPLPFGILAYVISKIGFKGASIFGAATAALSVFGMLAVVGFTDGVSILPDSWREWRETFEYGLSIALAFVSGNIMATIFFVVLPSTIAAGGRPNPAAYRIARLLGDHVGTETLRRRARRIQSLMQTVGPVAGLAANRSRCRLYRPERYHRLVTRSRVRERR